MKTKIAILATSFLLLAFVALQTGCKKEPLKTKPVACTGALPDTLSVSKDFTFNASCSEEALSYLWTFGDGDSATTAVATHNYFTPGVYTVTLTVTNAEGQTSISKNIEVKTLICNPGYEGYNCKTEMRFKFIGDFSGYEACTTGPGIYEVQVLTNAASVQSIFIKNLNGFGINVAATVNKDSLTIPTQTLNPSGTVVSGTGIIYQNTLSINYTLVSNGNTNTCAYSAAKQ